MSTRLLWLGTADGRCWQDLLARAAGHDVYHLPTYHALAEARGEGEPRLLVCTEGDAFIALPLLLRPIGLPRGGAEGLRDATSVYGYAGPVASAVAPGPRLVERFKAALRAAADEHGIVTVFSRLHPLLPDQPRLLDGVGELRDHGSTVSVDLRLPPEEQRASYSTNHRRDLEKLRKAGFAC